MIIVSGLHRKNGQVRTQTFLPGNEGDARKFRLSLRRNGYTTALVNDVKEAYRARAAGGMRDAFREDERKTKCGFRGCQRSECSLEEVKPFSFEGIVGFQLHSLGTGSGARRGEHVAGADTRAEAEEKAQKLVERWSNSHKGIVLYAPVALIRKITKPSTEVVELS